MNSVPSHRRVRSYGRRSVIPAAGVAPFQDCGESPMSHTVPFRFLVDNLRVVDVRYLGLTPGQYGCVALMLVASPGLSSTARSRCETARSYLPQNR